MEYLTERVAYLKGLMDGLKIDDSTNEGKVLIELVDVLNDMVYEIVDLNSQKEELEEYIEAIDEDLSNAEDELYGFDDSDYNDNPHYIEVECPNCKETVYFSEDLFDTESELICPNCKESIYEEDDSSISDSDN